uniref:Uncharacterized protein n=1 Tax=Fagus sylvatica TaxID=28930 RepID=A0A2N9G275_FAGSY
MPASDSRAGSTFICLITVLLFLSMVVGGGCLIISIIQPDLPLSSRLPFVGMALIGLPWLFWVFTCCYRCMSRTFGYRVGAAGGGEGGSAIGGGRTINAVKNAGGEDVVAIEAGNVECLEWSPESDARRRAQFEAILALDDLGGEEGNKDYKKRSSSSSSSSGNDNISVVSHESELPFASS